MAQGLNSTKSAARPSHEAIESDAPATEAGNSAEKRLDHAAMESAKRAENRIHSNEETTPNNSIFSK
jgi:transcription elongation GreA/GreB family factor